MTNIRREVGGREAPRLAPHPVLITFLIWQAVDDGECLLEWDYSKGDPPAPLLKDMFGSERRYSPTNYRRGHVHLALNEGHVPAPGAGIPSERKRLTRVRC